MMTLGSDKNEDTKATAFAPQVGADLASTIL
ncbi:MAG: hypothetical protein ACJASD_003849 [Sphingomonas echinoides]|jgi:hypothetical protein